MKIKNNIIIYTLMVLVAIGFGLLVYKQLLFAAAIIVVLFTIFLILNNLNLGIFFIFASIIIGQLIRIPVPGREGGAILLTDLLIPMIVLVWFLKKQALGEKFKKTSLGILILIFSAIGFISYLFGIGTLAGSEKLISLFYLLRFISYAAFYFVILDIINTREDFNKYFKWLIDIGLIIAILGIIQLFIIPDSIYSTFAQSGGWDPHSRRLLSTVIDPNFAGAMITISLGMAIGLFLGSKSFKERYWLFCGIIVLLVALVLTYSRSSYLAFLVTFFIIAVIKQPRYTIYGLIIFLAIFFSIPRVQQRIIDARQLDATAKLRLKSWSRTFKIIQDHPIIGVGYNSFAFAQRDYGFVEDINVHNVAGSDSSFLTILATTGVIGFASYLLIYLSILLDSARIYLNKILSVRFRSYALSFGAVLVGIIIHAQFNNSLLFPQIMLMIWIGAGLLTAGKEIYKTGA